MQVREFDPRQGQGFQGDIFIMPVPEGIVIAPTFEIKPRDGRLIIQEGEVSGHHHAVDVLDRPKAKPVKALRAAEKIMADAVAGKIALPAPRMFRDDAAVQNMFRRGFLTRTDLAIGFLVIDAGDQLVVHEEHNAIRCEGGDGRTLQPNKKIWPGGYAFQAGRYLFGGQVESAGAEERKVVD